MVNKEVVFVVNVFDIFFESESESNCFDSNPDSTPAGHRRPLKEAARRVYMKYSWGVIGTRNFESGFESKSTLFS